MMNNTEESIQEDKDTAVSVIDELERLYGVSVEGEPANTACDDDSAGGLSLEDIEALYGSVLENPSQADGQNQAGVTSPANEGDTGRDTLLEELEELFADSNDTGDTGSDTGASPEIAEDITAEPGPDQQSALDELRAFLGEDTQSGSDLSETSESFEMDDVSGSHRSVLDELEALLQSCLDELKMGADAAMPDSPSYTVYPGRDELRALLESALSQLLLYSDDSAGIDATGNDSVLDELRSFMDGFETAGDDYMPAEEAESVELDDSEFSEDMTGPDDSGDNSVLDELDSYMAGLSHDDSLHEEAALDVPPDDEPYGSALEPSVTTAAVEDALAEDGVGESAYTAALAKIDTLEELESMLDDIRSSNEDETDSTPYYQSEPSAVNATEAENADDTKITDTTSSINAAVRRAPVKADPAVKDKASESTHISLHDDDSGNNRVMILGMLFTTAVAAVFISIWILLDSDSGKDYSAETVQVSQAAIPEAKDEARKTLVDSPEPLVVARSVTTDNYAAESDESSYIEIASEERPVAANAYEPYIDDEVQQQAGPANTSITADPYQAPLEYEAETGKGMQLKMFQQQSQEKFEQLDKRLTEAESSIKMLQTVTNETHKQKDLAGYAVDEAATIPEKHEAEAVYETAVERPYLPVPVEEYAVKKPDLWSVHLSSYYGKPPPDRELSYLDKAGISYELRKAIINDKDWYRVIVDEFSDYEEAKKYAETIRGKVGRKDIWINRSQ